MTKREAAYHRDKELWGSIKYLPPNADSYDAAKIRRCLLDEQAMYVDAGNPQITFEDVQKWKEEMDKMGIGQRTPIVDVKDLGNGTVQLSGKGIFGIVDKKKWSDALQAAAKI